MITIEQIREMANPITYAKGEEIYKQHKIIEFHVDEDMDFRDITALVIGSTRNIYEVTATVDLEADDITDIGCECLAFATYSGICKHCVAVLLRYMDYQQELLEAKTEGFLQKNGMKSKKAMITKGMKPTTTPVLGQLLKKTAEDRMLPLLEQGVFGEVHLQPTMYCEGMSAYLEFKIGITQMYVVKDVFELIRLVERRSRHRYGKKLEFLHCMEAFDTESQPLIAFLQEWTQVNESRYRQHYYYSYSYGGVLAKSKQVDMDGHFAEEYLEIMRGRTLEVYITGMKENTWQISEDPRPRNLKITGDKNGVELKLDYYFGYELERKKVYFHEGMIYLEMIPEDPVLSDFAQAMSSLPSRSAYIEAKDIPVFCRDLLPALERYYQCEMKNFDKEEYGVESPEFSIYLDSPQTNMITCKTMVKYGEKEYSLYDRKDLALRNLEEELSVRKLVHEYGNAFDEHLGSVAAMDDEEVIYELLVYGIPRMQKIAEVFISDAIKKMEVRSAPKITVGVSIESGLMELTLDSGDMPRDELIEILSKYNRKKKFYRLKDGTFINGENSGLEDMVELREGLQLTDKQLEKDVVKLDKFRALYVDAQLKDSQALSAARDKSFRELIRNMKTVEDNDFEVPASLESTLREYQKRGFLWLKTLKHNGFGGILADDMGLGKTLQVIAFLLSEQEEQTNPGKTLIVTPASLVFNWYEEFQKFAPELSVHMAVGTAAQRREIIENLENGEILITSYDLLKRDMSTYEKLTFTAEFIDEAQYIKNHNTQAAKAVKTIEATFKVALTGTPVENRLSELWSIFDYLMPGFLYRYKKFREEIETPIVVNQDDTATQRLKKMISPFVLRRLKKDVLKDLPDKLEECMYAQMGTEQKKLYDAHVQRLKILLNKQSDEEFKNSKIVVLSELTKLRQLCCDPGLFLEDYKGDSAKKEMCITLIQNAIDNGHKILLFSQFTTMLGELAEQLRKAGISYYMLTGATSKEKRRQMVKAFNEDDTSVFCISLKAGGTGLNLTAADLVIHYDPWWNLAVQNQATDRAHRIGQEHVVNVYKLIVKNSIEENIVKMQEKKRELADQILSGEGMDGGSFTREELLEIL